MPRAVLVLGAAGRDFHNFNVVFRDDPEVRVVAFTQAQIPRTSDRRYPASLAGPRYPDGIPIVEEADLELVCRREAVEQVVFAYSDVTHEAVMHLASRALAVGADFAVLGPRRTMLRARVPVIAISAVRTGCGKSQTARWLGRRLRDRGHRVAVLRHPMPYGELERERVQRFAARADLDAARCTAEEREEYEPHLAAGNVVFAGVDYAAVAAAAEKEADLIVWDGGNNDFPFLVPDLHIVIADALRPGQVAGFHPGGSGGADGRRGGDQQGGRRPPRGRRARERGDPRAQPPRDHRPRASPVRLDDAAAVSGRRVLVVEDGPTITHGGMAYGAGYVAATAAGAATIVDPRAAAAPGLAAVFARYPHIGRVLPAVGYSGAQLEALRDSINRARADVVVAATPLDLAALIAIDKPVVRARYDFAEAGEPTLGSLVDAFLARVASPQP